MKSKLLIVGVVLLMVVVPIVAGAQVGFSGATSVCAASVNDLYDLLCRIGRFINAIIPVLIALGVLYFVWGVITYVVASEEEAKTKGRDKMIFGIIGLVVILGLWALVRWITNTFNLNNTITAPLPTVPVVLPVP